MELFLELMASSSSVLDRRLERPECTEWLRLKERGGLRRQMKISFVTGITVLHFI